MAKINKKIENVYPLTPLQEGMLFHSIYDKNSTAYVIQDIFSVNDNMDKESVENALKLLSKRYSVLRTSFVYEGMKEIYQVVLKERFPEIKYYDFTELNDDIKQAKFDCIVNDDVSRGFDLKNDTLIRVIHIKYSEGYDKVIFNMHHIISDGWCTQKLFTDFYNYYLQLCNNYKTYNELYDEIEKKINILPNYSDYIKWLVKQDKEKARNYWKKELEGYENESNVTPMLKPETNENQMRICRIEVDKAITEKLKSFAENTGTTINIVTETVVGIMLQAYTKSNDVVFGKVVSGRNADIPGIEEMVGLFINTIPVRVKTDGEENVEELLKKQQQKGIESTNYDYYSLADIQNITSQGSELIKILYVFENYESGLKNEDDLRENTGITAENNREQTNYGITILGFENNYKLCFKIMYDPNIYCEDEIQLILERIKKYAKK